MVVVSIGDVDAWSGMCLPFCLRGKTGEGIGDKEMAEKEEIGARVGFGEGCWSKKTAE